MAKKAGGMFVEEGQDPKDIEFTFDKFIDEIVKGEKRAKEKKNEAVEETDTRKRIARSTESAGNRIRYRRKK